MVQRAGDRECMRTCVDDESCTSGLNMITSTAFWAGGKEREREKEEGRRKKAVGRRERKIPKQAHHS